jgi:hypothetical protein
MRSGRRQVSGHRSGCWRASNARGRCGLHDSHRRQTAGVSNSHRFALPSGLSDSVMVFVGTCMTRSIHPGLSELAWDFRQRKPPFPASSSSLWVGLMAFVRPRAQIPANSVTANPHPPHKIQLLPCVPEPIGQLDQAASFLQSVSVGGSVPISGLAARQKALGAGPITARAAWGGLRSGRLSRSRHLTVP